MIYVDDILILCKDENEIERVIEECRTKYIEIKSKVSNDFCYLGMHIVIRDGKATICMEGYINELLKFYNVQGSKMTPGTNHLFTEGKGEILSQSKIEFFIHV